MSPPPTTADIIEYWNERVGKHGGSSTATLLDQQMRALEIETAASWLRSSDRVLDIFCGNAFSTVEIARHCASVTGLDLSDKMLAAAADLLATRQIPPGKVTLRKGDILDLAKIVRPGEFNTVVSIRGLINLPSWEIQQQALRAIHSILPPGGTLLFLEGSKDGLARINALRAQFNLPPLQEPWYDKHFDEQKLADFMKPLFETEDTRSLDTYFLLSRVLYPLAAVPEEPRFDHVCNVLARLAVPLLRTDAGTTLLICAKFKKRG